MPSQPSAQACLKMIAPSPAKCLLKAMPSLVPRMISANVRLRSSSRAPAEVLAVEFDQIEGAKHGGVVAKPITESVEYREAAFVHHDGLAVNEA